MDSCIVPHLFNSSFEYPDTVAIALLSVTRIVEEETSVANITASLYSSK
ncbi:hypothetical protein [Lysinibacillus cavernae]|nr:hypothetical protein [Lysinibacillus cavernae]